MSGRSEWWVVTEFARDPRPLRNGPRFEEGAWAVFARETEFGPTSGVERVCLERGDRTQDKAEIVDVSVRMCERCERLGYHEAECADARERRAEILGPVAAEASEERLQAALKRLRQ